MGALALSAVLLVVSCAPPPPRRTKVDPSTDKKRGGDEEGDKVAKKKKDNDKKKEDGRGARKEKPPPPEPNPLVKVSASKEGDDEEGVIHGVVRWPGGKANAPPATAKPEECVVSIDGKPQKVRVPVPVYVGEKEGVADVMVWLENPPKEGTAAGTSSEDRTIRLVQTRGRFRLPGPGGGSAMAAFAPRGAALELHSTDDDADFQGTGKMTFSRTQRRNEKRSVILSQPGLVSIHSDERPWMLPAHILVLDHPYHAVTGKDGSFELPPVPPGEYQVKLWHSGWQQDPTTRQVSPVERRVSVKLGKKQAATIRWLLPGT